MRTSTRLALAALAAAVGVLTIPGTASAATGSTDLSKFTSSGTWTKESALTKWYSNSTGAYVTVPVTISAGGGTVTIKGTKADNYGFGKFSVDGGTATSLDLYATTRVENTPIWTTPTLLKYYSQIAPGNSLEKFLDEFAQIMAVPYDQRAAKSHELLDPQNFVAAWKSAAANDPKFKQAQRDERDRTYYNPALAQAKADGVGPLGLWLLYDISVNHGPGTDSQSFGGIVAAAQAQSPPPSKGGSEKNYLLALDQKRTAVLTQWGDNQPNGRDEATRELINAGEFLLEPPVTWHMYGEVFTIASNPTPR
jgi:hypothetical protein